MAQHRGHQRLVPEQCLPGQFRVLAGNRVERALSIHGCEVAHSDLADPQFQFFLLVKAVAVICRNFSALRHVGQENVHEEMFQCDVQFWLGVASIHLCQELRLKCFDVLGWSAQALVLREHFGKLAGVLQPLHLPLVVTGPPSRCEFQNTGATTGRWP